MYILKRIFCYIQHCLPLKAFATADSNAHRIPLQNIHRTLCFMQRETRTINANAHLAHLQAQTHRQMLQLAKEPNFCRRTKEH